MQTAVKDDVYPHTILSLSHLPTYHPAAGIRRADGWRQGRLTLQRASQWGWVAQGCSLGSGGMSLLGVAS